MALDTMNCTVDNLNGILLNAVSQIVSPIWLFALRSDSSSLQGNTSFHFRTKEHMWSRGSAHFELVSTAVPKNATSSRSRRQAGTPRPRSVRAGLLYRKGGEVAQNRLVVCVSRLPLLPPKLTDARPSAIKAPTPSSLPQRLRRVSQDSDSLRLVSLYSPAPPAMHFLDPFLREDLFHFVEAIIHSIDTPASSPAPDVASSETARDSVIFPNALNLAQTFIGKVAAFGPHAPYPDDLHARFRDTITHFPEAARLTKEQLKAFDNEYSSLTRERVVIFRITQQSTALHELVGVRSRLREAEAQHDLHANNRSTSRVAAAQKEFDRKCAHAMASTKLLVRGVEERKFVDVLVFIACDSLLMFCFFLWLFF